MDEQRACRVALRARLLLCESSHDGDELAGDRRGPKQSAPDLADCRTQDQRWMKLQRSEGRGDAPGNITPLLQARRLRASDDHYARRRVMGELARDAAEQEALEA
jgi:hypothetical protein